MTERFLHYLWKMKLLNNNHLTTTEGSTVRIISSGEHNSDSGPDFHQARIKIDETTWVGNVEIHLRSSDWLSHHHHEDKAYDNVILHVVYVDDDPVLRQDGSKIPCLEIRDRYDAAIYENYQSLMQSPLWIPCEHQIKKVNEITIHQWLNRLTAERLEAKIQPILHTLKENENNWEQTFYEFVAMSYGSKVNAEPFRLLARALSVKVLARHKNNLFQLEALLFGTAGFLNEQYSDSYPEELRKEWGFLQMKYGVTPLKKHLWKFLRLRPANFPTVRIAQMAQLIFKSAHLFSRILETTESKTIASFFKAEASEYWSSHYLFDKLSDDKNKSFGKSSAELILINTVAPFIFVYGKLRDEQEYCDRAIKILEHISAERNNIIENWKRMGISPANAFDSQALLQLRNCYCKNFRCLDCAIGHKILLTGKVP
ncbi:MAG: DUF2851 family protein [Chitinophagales bacterium]|nr:DUF2851 family protein [Chitinophagales bacterium]